MKLSEIECEQLAGEVYDKIIAPSLPKQWHTPILERQMRQFEKIGYINPPPLTIINGMPVYAQGEVVSDKRRAIDREYAESMKKLERAHLVPLLTEYFIQDNYTAKHKEELFSGYASNLWWGIMEEIEKFVFQTKKGRKAKIILEDYGKISVLADELFPVIEKLLTELEGKTKHSVKEILEFLITDYPKPCKFLLTHLAQLEKALSDKKFLQRRKTLKGRARILAQGIAGANYGLKLSTSAAIAGQGKRSPS